MREITASSSSRAEIFRLASAVASSPAVRYSSPSGSSRAIAPAGIKAPAAAAAPSPAMNERRFGSSCTALPPYRAAIVQGVLQNIKSAIPRMRGTPPDVILPVAKPVVGTLSATADARGPPRRHRFVRPEAGRYLDKARQSLVHGDGHRDRRPLRPHDRGTPGLDAGEDERPRLRRPLRYGAGELFPPAPDPSKSTGGQGRREVFPRGQRRPAAAGQHDRRLAALDDHRGRAVDHHLPSGARAGRRR